MPKKVNLTSLFLVGLMLFPLGYIIGNTTASDSGQSSAHSSDDHSGSEHASHSLYEVPVVADAPLVVSFEATPDTKSGWNISLVAENFSFTPQNAGAEHVEGEGHAHLYVDGVKVARLYGDSYHLDHVDEGTRELTVTLNTNDHQEYAVNGSRIEATTFIDDTHHSEE